MITRLQHKLTEVTSHSGISLDHATSDDFAAIMDETNDVVKPTYPEDSFQRIFWQQQKDAASKSRHGMRWHPLMIKWCIYLRHQSGKAYETVRDSGCISLPSQRTLRDYTNSVKAYAGFSAEVDHQLFVAANLESCSGWQKLVFLLLDEMHVREDLVYDKHSGSVIGFVNLGDTNNHLLRFERSLENNEDMDGGVLAKSMLVIMVRGLFTSLRFPYAQFPCERLTGNSLEL